MENNKDVEVNPVDEGIDFDDFTKSVTQSVTDLAENQQTILNNVQALTEELSKQNELKKQELETQQKKEVEQKKIDEANKQAEVDETATYVDILTTHSNLLSETVDQQDELLEAIERQNEIVVEVGLMIALTIVLSFAFHILINQISKW